MTHDELLAKIDSDIAKTDAVVGLQFCRPTLKALRAIVELAGKLQDEDPFHEDAGWNAGYNHAMYEVIQAIEKELA